MVNKGASNGREENRSPASPASRMSVRPILAALCWALASFFLRLPAARGALDEPDFSQGMLDRGKVMASAAAVTTNTYPDAELVLVAGKYYVAYNPDGTYVQWHEEYVKILTEEGRRSLTTLSSFFTIPYQRGPEDCRVPLVEIIKPSGMVVAVDVEKHSKVMVNPGAMAANIYNPNEKLIQVNVANLEIGDVLHFVMFDRIVQPRMKDTWCDLYVLEETRPILSETIEIVAPRTRPLASIRLKDQVEGTVTFEREDQGELICYRWTVRDVPRMFPEPNMPPLHTVVQRLLVSTAPDWQTVSRWYWEISAPHYQTTPEMDAKVRSLTAGMTSPQQKMEALFRFVSQQIRYMGITVEATAPGYEPHDVKETFAAKHGVCRDKAALLVVLLRLAGFEAFPALIDTGAKKDPEVPLPYFNHAIVAVRQPDGDFLLMDPTSETANKFLPAYLNDKNYLVATPEGTSLRTSLIDPAENNLLRIVTRGSLGDGGVLTATSELFFEGINDTAYRGWFARNKPEDRRRFFEGLLKRCLPGTRLKALEISPADMLDITTGLSVRLAYEAPDILVRGKDVTMLPLPALGNHIGFVNRIVDEAGLKTRKYPFFSEVACGIEERIELTLPPELKDPVGLPMAREMSGTGLVWRFQVRQDDRLLRAERDFRLDKVEYSPSEYQVLKSVLAAVENDAKKMVLYHGSNQGEQDFSGQPDAVVLSEEVEYDLADARAWTERRSIRKRILTFAGKKQNAEVKLTYNTAWEDVHLEKASVAGRDGSLHQIRPEEINIMDVPWVGSARRYPPSRILVASLPAVEVGSVIEYTFTRTCSNREFFAQQEPLRSFDALVYKSVKVKAPPGVRLETQVTGGDKRQIRATTRTLPTGQAEYAWVVEQVEPVKREEALPPWWTFNPTLFVSAGSWRHYARAVEGRLRANATGQSETLRVGRQIAEQFQDPWERVKAVRDYVAVRVREAGPLLSEAPLSVLSPADCTLADGYGNNADRAVLLYSLLTGAGFRPRFLLAAAEPLIGPLKDTIAALPYPPFFGQVLVVLEDECLQLAKGKRMYLNDGDQYDAVGASRHAGQCGLGLPHGRLEVIRPAEEDSVTVEYCLKLTETGATRFKKTMRLTGRRFGEENRLFSEMTPEERRRHFEEMVTEVAHGALVEGELRTDFSCSPGVIEFSVRVPEYAERAGEYLYVKFPELLDDILELYSDERHNPLYIGAGLTKEVRIEIERPAGFALNYWPLFVEARDVAGAGIWTRAQVAVQADSNGSRVIVQGCAWRPPCLVAPERYAELLEFDQALEHPSMRTIIFRQTDSGNEESLRFDGEQRGTQGALSTGTGD